MSEVVGLFPSRREAEQAIDELSLRGYAADDIGYLDRHRDEHGEIVADEDWVDEEWVDDGMESEASKGAAGGAIGGAAVGVGAGLLGSAGLLLVPGIGPFLAAGTLGATLGATAVGAAGGAVVGGAAGAIIGASDEDEDDHHETSRYYREGIAGGRTLVSVEVGDAKTSEVSDVLARIGAERVDVYSDGGWLE
ncbi:MAG TPA: hypothetical protein VMQ46_02260 [Acidimicrobiia bacterium]|nr:hypothetical protein [Acidimicrobiia bacterium]